MKIVKFVEGNLMANNYLIVFEDYCLLIDCSGIKALNYVKKNNLKLKYILLTHGHFDHIDFSNKIRFETGAKVCIHEKDAFMLSHTLNTMHLRDEKKVEYDILLKDKADNFKVIHTPGHTPGSVCFLKDKICFTGDTLFKGGVGRTDIPCGNSVGLKKSLSKLFELDGDVKIFPGHGKSSFIGRERQYL